MKSLYSILGVGSDASAEKIDAAYANLVARLQASTNVSPDNDEQIHLVAAREAYAILADPVARQRYDQKLLSSDLAPARNLPLQSEPIKRADSHGFLKILLIGVLALGGLGIYTHSAREKEKLRIEHEREIQLKAIKLLEEEQERKTAEQDARQARQAVLDTENRARRERSETERYMRDFDQRQRIEQLEEERRRQRETSEQQRKAREAEHQRQRELAETQRRISQDRLELQRLERERYRARF